MSVASFRHSEVLDDAGSLRADLIAALQVVRDDVLRIGTRTLTSLMAELADDELRAFQANMFTHGESMIRDLLARAVDRGELVTDQVPQSVATVAIALARQDLVFVGDIPDARIVEIVDDVAVPLLKPFGAQGE